MTVKVLLDTDIGSDIDDAFCLAYLLAQPQCDLLGITTVCGEADKRAMIVVYEPTWTGTDHAPGNSATVQVLAHAFPAERIRVLADPPHLATNVTFGVLLLGLAMGSLGPGIALLASYLAGAAANLALVGFAFYAQALVLYTPSGVAVSNGVIGTVGF